ncbi:MATE family efflux transporter, partial [Chloroflexota bacterium]
NLAIIRRIYRVGLPTILMELSESVVFILFNRVVGGFGSAALATLGIAGRIADFSFMLIIGTAHGVLPIVGFCYGAQLSQRLWATIKVASLGLAVTLGLATILLEIFTPEAIRIFNSDPVLLEIGVPGMRIFVSTLILIGPSIIFITAFQGLSKGWTATILALARQMVFFLPALLILPRYLGITGVWISIPISDGCGAIVSALWLYREYRLQQKSDTWQTPLVPEVVPKVVPHGMSSLDQ